MKTCTGCKQELPLEEFWARRKSPDGLALRCKSCIKAYQKSEAVLARRRVRENKHYAEVTKAEREAALLGRTCEFCLGALQLGTPANTRFCSKRCNDAAYYRANQERIKQRVREWEQANRERVAENHRLWKQKNPERLRELRSAYNHRRRARIADRPHEEFAFEDIFDRDGWVCGLCDMPVNPAVASLDHIIPISKGGSHTRDNVQLAHLDCNKAKGDRLITRLVA